MLVVVGGHTRNIGKTSVAAGLISRLRDLKWTAVKITQYGHGVCSREGQQCGCETELDHPYALSEEYAPGDADSERFLAAGAERSFWLRTRIGELSRANGVIRKLVEKNTNVIMESTSVVELVDPDVFLMVLDFSCRDFKASSLRMLDRADGFVIIKRGLDDPLWSDVDRRLWQNKPQFPVNPPTYVTPAVAAFVRAKLAASAV
jgi:hypothetical protein